MCFRNGKFRFEVSVDQSHGEVLPSTHSIWSTTHKKGLYAICGQRRPWLACANAQADLGLSCPLTESMATLVDSLVHVYVDKHGILRLDCADAHSDLGLRCPRNAYGPFSCVALNVFVWEMRKIFLIPAYPYAKDCLQYNTEKMRKKFS